MHGVTQDRFIITKGNLRAEKEDKTKRKFGRNKIYILPFTDLVITPKINNTGYPVQGFFCLFLYN
jgi:hypothetical protein